MSGKASLLERLMGGTKKKKENQNSEVEAQVKERLKSIVYDDELVEELTPVFMSLQTVEGFGKVIELLEAKEQQIEAISGGDWFKTESEGTQHNNNEENENEDEGQNLVDLILLDKYK